MVTISLQSLVEAGVHFGHQTQRWNPKMAPYIYGEKQGIYIINLQKTLEQLKMAYEYVQQLSTEGKEILFVGTKQQARGIIKQHASECGAFYVSHRWLGGMMTNFTTIKQSITKLEEYESLAGEDNSYPSLFKKEAIRIHRKREKLEQSLGGIRSMDRFPAAIFVVDCNHEHLAINEARKLSIPVIGIADTNVDPDDLSIVIPGNDDSTRTINLFVETLTFAVKEGKALREEQLQIEAKDAPQSKKDSKTKPKKESSKSKEQVKEQTQEKPSKKVNDKAGQQISAKLVKELREISGAGMMECKKALKEVDGDFEAAKEHLRKTGQAKALKKSDRATKDGSISFSINDTQKSAAIVQIACETDFVAKNEQFVDLLMTLSSHAESNGVQDFQNQKLNTGKTIQETLNDAIAGLGENIQFLDAKHVLVEQGVVGGYLHTTGKIGVLIALTTKEECDQSKLAPIAKDIAMHVAAIHSEAIAPDEIDQALIEKEKEIFIAQAKESGKPDNIIEKMVTGRIQKFLNEVCILKQAFVKNPDQTIEQLLTEKSKELGTEIQLKQFAKLQF